MFINPVTKPILKTKNNSVFTGLYNRTLRTTASSAGCSDSGTLLNQDYVNSSDYFADDYVGAKRAL